MLSELKPCEVLIIQETLGSRSNKKASLKDIHVQNQIAEAKLKIYNRFYHDNLIPFNLK